MHPAFSQIILKNIHIPLYVRKKQEKISGKRHGHKNKNVPPEISLTHCGVVGCILALISSVL